MGADIARCWCPDDMFAFRDLSFCLCLDGDLLQVVTDGLGQTGGVYGDNFRFIDRENILNCLQEVGLTTEN